MFNLYNGNVFSKNRFDDCYCFFNTFFMNNVIEDNTVNIINLDTLVKNIPNYTNLTDDEPIWKFKIRNIFAGIDE